MACQLYPSSDYKKIAYGLGEEEVVVLRLHSQVLEYRVGPEAFHKVLHTISTPSPLLKCLSIPSCLSDHA